MRDHVRYRFIRRRLVQAGGLAVVLCLLGCDWNGLCWVIFDDGSAPPLEALYVNGTNVPDPITLTPGQTCQFSVTAVYGQTRAEHICCGELCGVYHHVDVTPEASYSSSDVTVASVSETGRVTAVGIGTATITVEFGLSSDVTVTVKAAGQGE